HLDFSDLEREALALLRRHREEGRRPHRNYRHILVDEYQDTNPIQEAIIDAIRGGAERFAVGDPGQSIYRFRGAELGALVDYEREVGEPGTILLDRTYRPSPALLAFQNAFFEKLFEEGPNQFARMEPGAEFVPREDPSVEILMAAGEDSRSAREAEAAMIAGRVEEIVKGKSLRFTRKDPGRPFESPQGRPFESPQGKPIGEGDIAILLRSATHLAIYERALGARGIRSFAGIGGGFYSSLEVMDLENLLRVIVRPDDRTALAAFFASPFVGMTDEDLLRFLAWWTGAPAGTPWEEAIRAEGMPAVLVEQVRRAHGVVRSLREVEGSGGLLDLVERMIRVGRYDLVTLLQQGGTRRLANLRKLEGIARRLDRDGGHGARDFLRMIEDLRDRDSREAEATVGSEAEEVVRIMTVHGAKGLEFPVVILANIAARPRLETAPIRSDRRGGIAFKIHGDDPRRPLVPGGYAALAEAESNAATAEERRLLYVAMTRVQEHLILSCGISPRRASWSEWLKDVLRICDIADPPEAGRYSLGEGTFDVRTTEGVGRPALRGLERTALADKVPTEAVLDAVHAGRGIGPLPEADLTRARASWDRVSTPGGALDVVPFIASTSDLIRFDACPLAYFWSGLVGVWEGHSPSPSLTVPSPRPGEDEVLDREDRRRMGTAVHAILETCSLDRGPSDEDVRRILQEELGRAATSETVDRAKDLARSFLESDWGRKARDLHGKDSSRVIRERPFLLRHEGLLVKGTVDLILLPSGESGVVIDYKSGSASRTNGSRAGYALQMQIYSLALDKILGIPTAAILFYLQDGVDIEVAPNEEVVTDLFRRFREAHESTAPGKGPEPHFPARPSLDRCRACEFRRVCPAAEI
ncbi:MAG: PD-(D/E)XK nuclease family protein, partial [Planctomycetota bacterium]|nr:PD-(D/E)XK nuclease family protein [Planctomycetota bacterium]